MRSIIAALCVILTAPCMAETGIASVYSGKRNEGGSKASNGERINPRALTAAHKRLAFNSLVAVTNLRNQRTIIVRIVDRGPFKRGRVIDLTPAGARLLGFEGLATVTVMPLLQKPPRNALGALEQEKGTGVATEAE